MKSLGERYYELSNSLLEKSSTAKIIGHKAGGNMIGFRKHYRSILDHISDLQAHADLVQEIVGDRTVAKQIATIAATIAQAKAVLNQQIAASTITPVECTLGGSNV